MAKGRYNISVSGGSNLEASGNNNNETEFENQECMNSCLSSSFLRSLSFHDRPRSSRVPTNKELHKSRYKPLVSSSLEKIPPIPLPSTEGISEYRTYHDFECIGIDAEVEMTTQSTIYDASSSAAHQQTDQNQLSGTENWLEDNYTRFYMEAEKLLEETIAILRTVDKDISESLINLSQPESIALESVIEVYKNKGKKTVDCSAVTESDLSTELSSRPIYENWQPSVHQTPKDVQVHSTPQRPKDLHIHISRQNPKDLQAQSPRQSPKNLQAHSAQRSSKNLQAHSAQQNSKNLQAHSPQQSPKNLQAQSQQTPKNLVVHSSQQTLKTLQSLLSSDSENIQSLSKPDSDNPPSVEQSSRNVLSSPEISASDDTTERKSFMEFDLPSDHELFIEVIEALQTRCLEYREMIQDVAVLALEECLNFSELSISRIQHLRKQFESQKRNFRDFQILCCESVVFGPDSQSIGEKVTEVIQSFYLKLLQEENETFMSRLAFGLKMSEIYAKMLKFETESKEIITTLKKKILYLKKTSVGFKV